MCKDLRKTNNDLFRDVISYGCIFLTAVYLLFFSLRGLSAVDESFYFTIPHRVAMGDCWLTEEWHISQFSSFLQILPFRLFYAVTGSTEGVILFFRRLYILLQSAAAVYLYSATRKYGWISTIFSLVFCHHIICGILTLNYYTAVILSCMLLCVIVFIKRSFSPASMLSAGIFLALAVLAQPLMALTYFIWLVCVVVFGVRYREKRTEIPQIFQLRSFAFSTAGVLLCAAPVVFALLRRRNAFELLRFVPRLFEDPEYVFTLDGSRGNILLNLHPLADVIKNAGAWYFIGMAVLLVVVAADKKRFLHKHIYFACATALFSLNAVLTFILSVRQCAALYYPYLRDTTFTLYTLVCFLLVRKKDKNMLAMWLFGIWMSLLVDISAENTVMLGGIICMVPGFVFIRQVMAEGFPEKRKREKDAPRAVNLLKITYAAGICVFCLFELAMFGFENTSLYFENFLAQTLEAKTDVKLDKGPMKGIYTSEEVADLYYGIAEDLDRIKAQCEPDTPVRVESLMCWTYLYLDQPYGVSTTWYVAGAMEDRLEDYYELYPEKTAGFVYIPEYNWHGVDECKDAAEEKLRETLSRYGGTVTEGEKGYIVDMTDIRGANPREEEAGTFIRSS